MVNKVIKPYFAPGFEAYLEARKLFAANKALLGIASNYVAPTGDIGVPNFQTLSPHAATPVPAAMTGITFDVDTHGNVLLNQPAKDVNRNFTLDGHRGSVLTFAGIPLIAFDPTKIDQSDATSRMPIPGTPAKATRESGRNPPSSRPPNATESTRPTNAKAGAEAPARDSGC